MTDARILARSLGVLAGLLPIAMEVFGGLATWWDAASGAALGVFVWTSWGLPAVGETTRPSMDARAAELRDRLQPALGAAVDGLHIHRARELWRYLAFGVFLAAGLFLAWRSWHAESWTLRSALEYAIGISLTAIVLNALFLVIHEAVHETLPGSRASNRAIGVALGALGFVSFSAYRVLHLRHHAHLGGPEDPDDYGNYSRSSRVVWFMHYNRLLWATLVYLIAMPPLAWRRGTPADRRDIFVEYALLASGYAVVFASLSASSLLGVWIVPFLLTNLLINARGLTQHSITDSSDASLASRTVLSGPLTRFFLLNENYHFEHHLFPGVPGAQLHRLHLVLDAHLPRRVVARSYLSFLWSFLRASRSRDERPIGLVTPLPSREPLRERFDGIERLEQARELHPSPHDHPPSRTELT